MPKATNIQVSFPVHMCRLPLGGGTGCSLKVLYHNKEATQDPWLSVKIPALSCPFRVGSVRYFEGNHTKPAWTPPFWFHSSSNFLIIPPLSLWMIARVIATITPLVNSMGFTFMERSDGALLCKIPQTEVLSGWHVSWCGGLHLVVLSPVLTLVLSPSLEIQPSQLAVLGKLNSLQSW